MCSISLYLCKILHEEIALLLTQSYCTACCTAVIMAAFMNVRTHPKVYQNRMNRDETNPSTYHQLFRFDKEHVDWLAGT